MYCKHKCGQLQLWLLTAALVSALRCTLRSLKPLMGYLCVQLRYAMAVPVVLLHFACAAATAQHVCAATAFTAVSLHTCTATAWLLQVQSKTPLLWSAVQA